VGHLTPHEVEQLMTGTPGGRCLAKRDARLIMMACRHWLRAVQTHHV
jgi:hypothetical protein